MAAGTVTKETVLTSVGRLFRQRIKLGMFDPPLMNPWNNVSFDVVEVIESLTLL